VPDEFHSDKTLLTFHKTPSLFLLVMSVKFLIFNVIKSSIKTPLILTS
jgi:hypothetical protein